MDIIFISVFTNYDDDKRIEWIDKVCCRPMIGDNIMSKDKQHTRKVCSITHTITRDKGEPYFLVEVKR